LGQTKNMGQTKKEFLTIEELAENLATFAINRDELKMLLQAIPENMDLNLTTVEYELQILKILSVGWAISFYMPPEGEYKMKLVQFFWNHIREISASISNLTGTSTGREIDYFAILKERLDMYLKAMEKIPKGQNDPSCVMGPAFASACKSDNNAAAILTGTKMFTMSLGGVREYLDAVEIKE